MSFEGPTPGDIVNINALNRAYLGAARLTIDARPLSATEVRRLASAPFLLFSLREQESDYWDVVFAADKQGDLIDERVAGPMRRLQTAALGFIWQLSRRNAYVARIVCGAPAGWCERLAEATLMGLLESAACRPDLVVPRFGDEDPVMQRLLQNGIRGERRLQRMSQHLALQVILTGSSLTPHRRLRAAACDIRPVPRRVAERATGRKV